MPHLFLFFFFNDTATTEIYTLSLHDALPIYITRGVLVGVPHVIGHEHAMQAVNATPQPSWLKQDRKSTRLNSSHSQISYAVFCLKKKKKKKYNCMNYRHHNTYINRRQEKQDA